MKKVKLKTEKQLHELVKKGLLTVEGDGPNGEVTWYAMKDNPNKGIHYQADFNTEVIYDIIDSENPIPKSTYEEYKIFFEDIDDE